ncbi:DUF6414 family protein [Brevibacillus panacihumi]|uniref:DUF6414 family protein n=1 Tax=Brevibacillus panacihumi TaxID=497735 RepID=UPI003D1C5783
MILRNFLYIDTNMLNDFLSTIDGYLEEGTRDQTELEKSQKSGKANAKVIEGNLQFDSSTEIKQKLSRTEASKFQKLYAYLQDNGMSQFLDAFDEEIWKQIRRGEILEVPAKTRLPKTFQLIQDFQSMTPMVEIMQALGEVPFKEQRELAMFKGASILGEQAENQNVPLIFETESTKGYTFVCQLQRPFIRTDLNNLVGEADVIGKVQRIIPKGNQVEMFSLIPAFDSYLSTMNREEKRKFMNDKKKSKLAEVIKGPAMIITPLAIYR